MNTWPQSANAACSSGGFLPLHLICCAGVGKSTKEEDKAALEIVRLLIEASHESVLQTTEEEDEEEGYLPIHDVASHKSPEFAICC